MTERTERALMAHLRAAAVSRLQLTAARPWTAVIDGATTAGCPTGAQRYDSPIRCRDR